MEYQIPARVSVCQADTKMLCPLLQYILFRAFSASSHMEQTKTKEPYWCDLFGKQNFFYFLIPFSPHLIPPIQFELHHAAPLL